MRSLLIIIFLFHILYAQGIPAGTIIVNRATLNYSIAEVNFSVNSNEVKDIVDQKIDMQVVCQESKPVVVGVGEKKRALTFLLTNRGNGADDYDFTLFNENNSTFDVENKMLYLDDGDGVFSLLKDTVVTDVNLSSDESRVLFLVSDIPSDANSTSTNGIKVHSKVAGSLIYGESKKLEDYYVVMASREERLSDVCSYEVSNLAIELEKSATLSSDRVYIGSTIHYQIAVKVVGTGSVKNVVIEDRIPAGTVYLENSLKVDGQSFGDFNGTAIQANLGEIEQLTESSDPKHLVTFDVKVI
jgi:uncharacterized repeat protein (TIGR01451 family)